MQLLPNPGHQDGNETKTMIMAVVICLLVFIGFEWYRASSMPPPQQAEASSAAQTQQGQDLTPASLPSPQQRNTYKLQTQYFDGAVNLQGGRLDELRFSELDHPWFIPGGPHAQALDTGWLRGSPQTQEADLFPNSRTQWTPQPDGSLRWTNAAGQIFERSFTQRDGTYVLEVTDTITNPTDTPLLVQHYAQLIRKNGAEDGQFSNWLVHYGPLGWHPAGDDGLRVEVDYDDLQDAPYKTSATGGWWGITTQYFMSALLAPTDAETRRQFYHTRQRDDDVYVALVQGDTVVVPAGETFSRTTPVYLGPKSERLIEGVGHNLEEVIDYGWFHFMSAPMHDILMWLYTYLGNWGWSIVVLTLFIKIITLPLTWHSMKAMAKLKALQPEMTALQERYKDVEKGREQMAMEMMSLYKEHKVNPVSGCWPVLIQMPVFFAMYKVLLISYEIRGADFFWVPDLAVMDPYFILPLVMGASMWLQMRLNPQPADPVQAKVMQYLPVIFTVMFLWFPAGLVLYWLTNNVLTIAQQYGMMVLEKKR